MSISKEQISATARLARLRVDEHEVAELTTRISSILDMVDQMQSVDTQHIEPMASALDAVQVLRPDEAIIPEDAVQRRDHFQTNAPSTEDGLFLVPKVIE